MKTYNTFHVLIVDDSESARGMTREMLGSIGFMQISEAENGREAIDSLMRFHSSSPVGLVLLDWHMPVMNGLDLIHFVRKGLGNPQPKILLVTSETNKSNILEGVMAGADGYLFKPFNKASIESSIQKILKTA